jgi:hypothetical protein
MSTVNIQWKLGKPFGILIILAGFAALSQIPIIYHASEVLEVVSNDYFPAYIAIALSAFVVLTNTEMILYEALLIRLRSYDVKDYRIPFLSAAITITVFYIFYYSVYGILQGIKVFEMQQTVVQLAICQMVSLLLTMAIAAWFNKRQTEE